MRWSLIVVLLLPVLLIAHIICYQAALPVTIDLQGHTLSVQVGSQAIIVTQDSALQSIQLAPHAPVIHEYQIDGSDSTNNFTLDQSYFTAFSTSLYYRFQAWMRNVDGLSQWRNLHIAANGQTITDIASPENGQAITFQPTTSLQLSVELQQPETPMQLDLITITHAILHIKLDRNNHIIRIARDNLSLATVYFPTDAAPFAAMVIDFFLLTTIWAMCMLLLVILGDVWIGVLVGAWKSRRGGGGRRGGAGTLAVARAGDTVLTGDKANAAQDKGTLAVAHAGDTVVLNGDRKGLGLRPTSPTKVGLIPFGTTLRSSYLRVNKGPLHPVAWIALAASFVFVSWIALVQYHAEPHIYDSVAYLFAAKMYATGHLSAPIPPAVDRFPGPFMVQFQGRWFTQYAPGTSLTLVPGIWLGVPWLVEPLLGTFALLGIGLIAAQLYDRSTATIAVLLGTLSPFYSYLAASYLSHAVALFYFVWGMWAFLRFLHGKATWYIVVAAALFGMAGLTRDLVAVLFVCIIVPGLLLCSWKRVRHEWRRWLLPMAAFIVVLLIFLEISLGFNKLLTDSWLTAPRTLFFAGDHWGFGQGVGFYGQHTFAGGLVNLHELLTMLAIDLFGWPFYLTLAFLCIPFLTRKATRYDWLFLVAALLMTCVWVGYFYHGIYLGPRYLYETLPFLLILTARGILNLNEVGHALGTTLSGYVSKPPHHGSPTNTVAIAPDPKRKPVSIFTVLLIAVLLGCSLIYYLPRQVTLYNNFSGLSQGFHIDLSTLYSHPDIHNAIITTGDYSIYQLVLFPLNDPLLHDDVIYALASNQSDYTELHNAFPTRQIYSLQIAPDGAISYVKIIT